MSIMMGRSRCDDHGQGPGRWQVVAVGTPPFGDQARLARDADRFFGVEASHGRRAALRVERSGYLPFAEEPTRFAGILARLVARGGRLRPGSVPPP